MLALSRPTLRVAFPAEKVGGTGLRLRAGGGVSARPMPQEGLFVTRTEDLILSTIREATPVIRVMGRRVPHLARQTERALHSVALQYAEGMHARGGNRDAKLQGAYAEAKEAMTAVRVAVACGALSEDGARGTLVRLDHVAAVLHLKRTRPL